MDKLSIMEGVIAIPSIVSTYLVKIGYVNMVLSQRMGKKVASMSTEMQNGIVLFGGMIGSIGWMTSLSFTHLPNYISPSLLLFSSAAHPEHFHYLHMAVLISQLVKFHL